MALFARIVVRSLSTWKSGKKGTTKSTLRYFAAYLRLKRCETSNFGEKFVSFCAQLFEVRLCVNCECGQSYGSCPLLGIDELIDEIDEL